MPNYNTGTTGSKSSSAHTNAFTFTLPAGVLTNDVMVVAIEVFTYGGAIPGFATPTSGGGNWTQVGSTLSSPQGSFDTFAVCFQRVATASDASSTFSVSYNGTPGSTDLLWWSACMGSYTAFYTASPIGNVFTIAGVNATSVTSPSGTTARSGSWAIQTCQASISGSGSISSPPATNRELSNPGQGIDSGLSDSNGSAGAAGSAIGGGTWTTAGGTGGGGSAFTIELCTTAPAAVTGEAPTPPQIPHPLWPWLLEVAWSRADWQAQGVATPVATTWRLMDGVNGRPGIASSGTQPPAAGTSNGSNQVNGVSFYVTQGGMWFQGYWYYCCASGQSTSPASFALWTFSESNDTGYVLKGTTVTSGTLTAGAWNWVPLPTPVQLGIYGIYIAAVGVPSGAGFPDSAAQFGNGNPYSAGITSGPLRAFSAVGAGTNPTPGFVSQSPTTTAGSNPAVNMPVGNLGSADNAWLDVQVGNTAPAGYAGSYRLWPNNADADAYTSPDSSVSYVVGTEIQVSQPVVVNAIWYYVPSGMGSSGNQWATSADIWNVRTGVRVATQQTPVWINPYVGGVDGQSNSGRWVYTQLPGTVYLQAGDYYVTVYNGNVSPNGWSAKRLYYWQGNATPGTSYTTAAPGIAGITAGPLYAPTTPAASGIADYLSPSIREPGQSVFAVGPPNQFPNAYVGTPAALFQNYWVDLEATPAATYLPDQPNLPAQIPHPLWYDLLEVAAVRMPTAPGVSSLVIAQATTLAGLGTVTSTSAAGTGGSIGGAGGVSAPAVLAAIAALTGTGTVTAPSILAAIAALAGTGTVTAAAIQAAIATLTGQGTVASTSAIAAGGLLGGAGAVAAPAILGAPATLAGQGTVTAPSTLAAPAALTGTGTVTALATLAAVALLAGQGSITADLTIAAIATLTGTGTAGGPSILEAPATLGGTGSVAANGGQGSQLAGQGSINAPSVLGVPATAAGLGTVTAPAATLAPATLTGQGTLTPPGITAAPATLTGTGTVTALAVGQAIATLAGHGTLTVLDVESAVALLAGLGTLAGSGSDVGPGGPTAGAAVLAGIGQVNPAFLTLVLGYAAAGTPQAATAAAGVFPLAAARAGLWFPGGSNP
jgi:hypothetical protein